MATFIAVREWAARSRERPVADVPAAVRLILVAALALQIGWHAWRPDARAEAQALAPVPAVSALRIAALGDPAALAKLLMLRLQAHDSQPGVHIAFMDLDYERVAGWLDAIIDLDPRADSPLLAAARLYGLVPDPERQRTMFELVYRRFLEDPDRRWPWLAHAAVIAKHRLADPGLALRYARAVTEHATGPQVPAWVRDMSGLLAAEMGEIETARILVGGLLHSGRVTDRREIRFLGARLAEIEAGLDGPEASGREVASGAGAPANRAPSAGRDAGRAQSVGPLADRPKLAEPPASRTLPTGSPRPMDRVRTASKGLPRFGVSGPIPRLTSSGLSTDSERPPVPLREARPAATITDTDRGASRHDNGVPAIRSTRPGRP